VAIAVFPVFQEFEILDNLFKGVTGHFGVLSLRPFQLCATLAKVQPRKRLFKPARMR
jgi:hypothetical protein